VGQFDRPLTGKVQVQLSDGTVLVRGQILLQDCADTQRLVRTNFSLYAMTGQSWTPMTAPGHGGLGWVFSWAVELNQFDEYIFAARRKIRFFSQGPFYRTESATDLAISGHGFFAVRDPANNTFYVTRIGSFHLDEGGHLVTTNGLRVQGWSDVGLSVKGDIVIDSTDKPSGSQPDASVASFRIDHEGNISVILSDRTMFVRGQILLWNFLNLQALQLCEAHLYSNLEAALPLFTNAVPGTHGLGEIYSHALESLVPSLPELRLAPQSGVRLLASDLMSDATVEFSKDCLHWTYLGTISSSYAGDAEYFDTDTTQLSGRFYRLRQTIPALTEPMPPVSDESAYRQTAFRGLNRPQVRTGTRPSHYSPTQSPSPQIMPPG
jgi:hypothetical protein